MVGNVRTSAQVPAAIARDIGPMEEYRLLRDEVVMRIGKQQESATFALALLAALASFAVANGRPLRDFVVDQYQLFPTLSMLFVAFCLTCLDHEKNIVDIYMFGKDCATGGRNMRPERRWVTYRARRQQGGSAGAALASLGASAKYVVFLVPATLLTASPFFVTSPMTDRNPFFFITLVINGLLLALAVAVAVSNASAYRKLAR